MNKQSKSDSHHKILPNNVLLIDKPKGVSSFDVIRALRKKLGTRKIGHAGTLDPLASGLMLIGYDSGTKALHELTGLPKTYQTEVLLGKRTATGDMEGEVVEEGSVEHLVEEELREKTKDIIGTLRLEVPMYSAVKQGGVPLYKKVRRGEKPVIPIRDMQVFDVRFVSYDKDTKKISLQMDVASGVYVRSVVEEYGRCLGVPATVAELRRVSIGDFSVEDAESVVCEKTRVVYRNKQ